MERGLGQIGADVQGLWTLMQQLMDKLATAVDRVAFMDECLDILIEQLGADRGMILLTDSERCAYVVNARGRSRSLSPQEREEISKSVLRKALDSDRCVVWEIADGASVTESIAQLNITAAFAVPLRSLVLRSDDRQEADRLTRGVLYLDFREWKTRITEPQMEFIQTIGTLVSIILEQGHQLRLATQQLRQQQAEEPVPGEWISLDDLLRSNSMERVRREVEYCLHGRSSILITGESGTGKTLLAKAVAQASDRTPVVRAMLGSSDDLNTITSELFGHEKGSYSGAFSKRVGLVEYAAGGTLILDEVLNLPLPAQQLLLDFTQFGHYRPLGYDRPQPKQVDVRIIAITNGDVKAAIQAERFRQDLYFRLAGVTIHLPPLRERREDIPTLAEAVLRRADPLRMWNLSVSFRRFLLAEHLDWSGNIRQLQGLVSAARGRALAENPDANQLTPAHIAPADLGLESIRIPSPAAVPQHALKPVCARFQIESGELQDTWERLQRERETLDELERKVLGIALKKSGGVVSRAATELGIPRTTLTSRLKRLQIERL